jgi:hypothetical protein
LGRDFLGIPSLFLENHSRISVSVVCFTYFISKLNVYHVLIVFKQFTDFHETSYEYHATPHQFFFQFSVINNTYMAAARTIEVRALLASLNEGPENLCGNRR